jgi:TRAP-type mannitol/chloroaromatic compound transport system permease large subunit
VENGNAVTDIFIKKHLPVKPIVQRLGFDSIWFGVILVLVGEIGVIDDALQGEVPVFFLDDITGV